MARNRRSMRSPTPHFFKPLIPEFLTNFRIPISFLTHLGLQESTNGNEFVAVLKDPTWEGRVWPVRVDGDGRLFLDGWKEFADDHSLCVGDFLVFNHIGGYVFDVTVFDPTSACVRSFSAVKTKPKGKKSTASVRRAHFELSGNPYFRASVKKYCFGRHGMVIPVDFARDNNLMKRRCEMILIDQKDRHWPVILSNRCVGRNQIYFFSAWDKFAVANGLKVEDSVAFELIHSGSRPVMKFYMQRRADAM